jgi:flagellar basal-body rod modification protein FlgD
MSTSTTATATTTNPLNIKDYFASVKDGTKKSSVTPEGKLASRAAEKSQGALGKDDFLSLLVTQLQYQDPSAPSDNQQMAAQMAQFSSLESMQNIQKSIDNMSTSMSTLTGTQTGAANSMSGAAASGLLGKSVSIKQESVGLTAGKTIPIDLQGSSTSSLVLKDSAGKVVRTVPLSGKNSDGTSILGNDGTGTLQLNAMDDQGKPISGSYSAQVVGPDGSPSGFAFKSGVVTGLRFQEGVPYLNIGNGTYKMSDLISVQNSAGGTEAAVAAAGAATATTAVAGASDLSSGALAATLLGKQVSLKENRLELQAGKSYDFGVQAEGGSRLELSDSAGKVVRTIPLDGSGKVSFRAADDMGAPLSGTYTAQVKNVAGAASGNLISKGCVSGLEFHDGAPSLSVNGSSYKLGDLLTVASSAPESTSTSISN